MNTERRITREAAQAMLDQITTAVASGEKRADVQLAGMDLLMERVSDAEVTLRAPDQSEQAHLFLAASTAPAGYPAGLPFVPGEPVMVTGPVSSRSLIWWAPGDPEGLIGLLDREWSAAGWQLLDETQFTEVPATRRSYGKPGSQMYVMDSGGTVSLIQSPTSSADGR